jgi:hypothetical protein
LSKDYRLRNYYPFLVETVHACRYTQIILVLEKIDELGKISLGRSMAR